MTFPRPAEHPGLSIPAIRSRKGGEPLVMVSAYDAPGAAMADAAGVDIILVGDSVAMVVLGREDTLSLTVAEMAHHVAAVRQARPACLVVADMPWLSYHLSPSDTVTNAAVLIRAGAQAVKLEGGRSRLAMIAALTDAEIQVMGHLGLTPQSVHKMGGFKVQATAIDAAEALVDNAIALAEAGCFALVLEGIPAGLAEVVTDAVAVPTIGVGAGPHCDGQVLVLNDILGLADRTDPRFVRRYAELGAEGRKAVAAWAADVRSGDFPLPSESYRADEALTRWASARRPATTRPPRTEP